MRKRMMPTIFSGAPFTWPQGTWNLAGQFRGSPKVVSSSEVRWQIAPFSEDSVIAVESSSGHRVVVSDKDGKNLTFDHEEKAFTIPDIGAGVLLIGDHARRIRISSSPSFAGGRIYVAELAPNEQFGRISVVETTGEEELKGLIELAKKTAEKFKQNVTVHSLGGVYSYTSSAKDTGKVNHGLLVSGERGPMEVVPFNEIVAVEVY